MIVRWRWYQPTGIKACSGSPRAPDVLPGVLAGDAWCRPEAIGVTASPGHSPTSAPFVLLGTPWTSSRSRAREGDQASIHPVGTSCGSGPALPSWFTATELRRREVNRRIAVSVSVTEEYLRWPLRGALTATSQHLPVSRAVRPEGVIAVRKPMAGPAFAGSPRVADATVSLALAANKPAPGERGPRPGRQISDT